MKLTRIALALCALAFASTGWGQVYTKFGPVTGVLKGDVNTYQTSAAVAADIIGLYTGTCNSSTFLNGAGACATPAGVAPSGAQNLVYATPNGSTGAATLRAVVGADLPPINLGSTANGGVLSTSILLSTNGGTSNGFFSVTGPATATRTFTFPNASATVLTTNAAVTVPQGGTGAATLTGLLLGNGTSPFTAATSANVISLWTGTCSASTYLRGDGSCQSPGSGSPGGSSGQMQYNNAGSFAGDAGLTTNGTGTVTLTNGTLPTFIEKATTGGTDQKNVQCYYNISALAYNCTFVNDAFSAESKFLAVTRGTATAVTGVTVGNTTDQPPISFPTSQVTATNTATNFNAWNTCATGQATGQRCWTWRVGGAGDMSFSPGDDTGNPQTAHAAFDVVRGAGFVVAEIDISTTTDKALVVGGGQPLNGNYSWTAAYVGNGGVSLGSVVAVSGYIACADIPGSAVGASSATTFSVGTLPTAARPVHSQTVQLPPTAEDNGVIAGFTFTAIVNTNGTITFLKNNSSSGWTASNQKGVTQDTTMCYFLN